MATFEIALFGKAILTFVLVLILSYNIAKKRNWFWTDSGRIGFAVLLAHLVIVSMFLLVFFTEALAWLGIFFIFVIMVHILLSLISGDINVENFIGYKTMMKPIFIVAIIAIIAFSFMSATKAEGTTGRVVEIRDGSTLDFNTKVPTSSLNYQEIGGALVFILLGLGTFVYLLVKSN